jgi:ubiquinone/menaquinone biosynthesis C-methylase UbiE
VRLLPWITLNGAVSNPYNFGADAVEGSWLGNESFPEELPLLYTFTEPFIFSLLKGRKRILDVGCGDGWLTKRIANFVSPDEIVAIDIREEAIQKAKKLHSSPRISYMVYDAERIDPLELGFFDAIFARNSFHHFQNKEEFLLKAQKMLLSDGILLILDLDKEANHCILGIFITFLRSLQYNGFLKTMRIAWNTKIFCQSDFRRHRKEDVRLLRTTGWMDYRSVRSKAEALLPKCEVGRIGSIAGLGGCYYILYQKEG